MLRKILLPTILAILAYGFWISPDFKEIAAGVSIFLFGMLSLEEGFKAFSGGTLEKILQKSTDKLYKNDSVYAYDISKNLIAMAEITFTDRNSNAESLNEEMAMNAEDINEILEEKDN